jgi:hypothetical protein
LNKLIEKLLVNLLLSFSFGVFYFIAFLLVSSNFLASSVLIIANLFTGCVKDKGTVAQINFMFVSIHMSSGVNPNTASPFVP